MLNFMEIVDNCVDEGFSCEPVDGEDIDPREAKRRRKMSWCGKYWGVKLDPHTGTARQTPYVCGDLECDNCRGVKADEIRGRLRNAIINGHRIFVSVVGKDEATGLIGAVGKEGCLRIPGEEKDTVFHVECVYNGSTGVPLGEKEVEEFDLDSVLKGKPRRRNMSGMLGAGKAVAAGDDKAPTIKVEVVVNNGSAEQMKGIMAKVMASTSGFKPQDIQAVQNMVRQRTALIKALMAKEGIAVLHTYVVREVVDISKVNWV